MWTISSSLADSLFGWSNIVLIVGAALVFIGTIGSIKMGAVRERFSDLRISENERATKSAIAESDLAKAAAAKSNEISALAQLQIARLRKELGARQLNRDIFFREIAGSATANVEILYLQDDPECFDLAQQIARALETAKWPVAAPKPIPQRWDADSPVAMSVGGQPSGVTVVAHAITMDELNAVSLQMQGQQWVRTPWTVLAYAIGQSLGKVSTSAAGLNAPPEGTIRVVVAPR